MAVVFNIPRPLAKNIMRMINRKFMNWASAAVAMTACGIAFAISPPSLWQQRSSSVEKKSDASVFGKSENSLLKVGNFAV